MRFANFFTLIALAMAVLTGCSAYAPTQTLAQETMPKPQTPARSQSVKTLNATVAHHNKGKMTAEQVSQCQSLGGQVTQVGMLKFDFCQIKFDDAGKICQDGSECQSGSCMAPRRGVAIGQPNQQGMCSQTNSKFGCRQTISKGVAGSRICMD